MSPDSAGSPERQKLIPRVRVRPMRADDIDRVMAIEHSLKDAPHWPRSAYVTAINPDGAPHRVALVAENEVTGSVTGYAVAGFIGSQAEGSLAGPSPAGGSQAELETIAVQADSQHSGIGRRLLSALIDHMKAIGAQNFILEVRASNNRALALYRRQGWTETGQRPRYYSDPEDDAILMRLGLD